MSLPQPFATGTRVRKYRTMNAGEIAVWLVGTAVATQIVAEVISGRRLDGADRPMIGAEGASRIIGAATHEIAVPAGDGGQPQIR